MTADDAKENAPDQASTRGEQLDKAVENVGAAIEEKLEPIAEKVTEKFDEVVGGSSTDKDQ